MKKKNKWIKLRHSIITALAFLIIAPYTYFKYGTKIVPFKDRKRQYLILLNHQTAFDQFFVGIAFKKALYYLASEDLFSKGFISKLLTFAVAPIPIKKQTTDIKAVKTCIRVAKEGGSIVIAPEGNRTYDGKPVYMNSSIASMAKMLKLPIAFFRIEGGYGVQPRWSDVVRKGKSKAYVSRVIEPEDYLKLSDEELFNVIKEELYVNEVCDMGVYKHPKQAEFLERLLYVCPFCKLSVFESNTDIIKCKKCSREVRHLPNKRLVGIGFDFPFNFVGDWYDYQCDYVRNLEVKDFNSILFTDTAKLSEVIVYDRKTELCKYAKVELYGNKITINGEDYNFSDVSAVTVLGKNKLNIYKDGKLYQLKGDKRFNAIKYVNIFNCYKDTKKEFAYGKFLGL